MSKTAIPDFINPLLPSLNAWADQEQLIDRAITGFKECFDSESGTICGWTLENVHVQFSSFSLYFRNVHLSYPYVVTLLDINATDGEMVGRYRFVVTLDGEAVDDYMDFYKTYDDFAHRQQNKRKRT